MHHKLKTNPLSRLYHNHQRHHDYGNNEYYDYEINLGFSNDVFFEVPRCPNFIPMNISVCIFHFSSF